MTDLQLLTCEELAQVLAFRRRRFGIWRPTGNCRAMIETGFQVVVQRAKFLGAVYLHLARKQLA